MTLPISVTTADNLSRHLLCAVPQLQDPNFKRSVVLILEHNEDGAFGLVINNPMVTKVADVIESLDLEWHGDPEAPVRRGGPVEPIRGFVLHDQVGWDPLAETVASGLLLTTSLDAVTRSGATEVGGEAAEFLFLLGYAGWGAGQLEGEMALGSWVAVPLRGVTSPVDGLGVPARWIFTAAPTKMWNEALRSTGIDPARVVALRGRGEPAQS